MKSGVAKLIAETFPEARAADDATLKGSMSKLGDYSRCSYDTAVSQDCAGQLTIINLYSQYNYSRNVQETRYTDLRMGLHKVAQNECHNKHLVIGMPKIGAGLGGGDWSIISEIIEEELKDFNVIVYVLDPKEIPEKGEIRWY
jgi:O-acetyl-ADP-ribose deacetylase (regulator of RNase III)